MAALAGGLAAVVLGIIGIILWWSEFLRLVMGALPAMFILGGALAAYLGFEEIKDKKAAERLDDKSSELKKEVDTLKEEIKGLKEQKGTTEEGAQD
jgi:cell division protein FtsB